METLWSWKTRSATEDIGHKRCVHKYAGYSLLDVAAGEIGATKIIGTNGEV